MQVEFNDIVKDFKKKDFKPIYFFCGEENFFIDELMHLAETSIIPEESKDVTCAPAAANIGTCCPPPDARHNTTAAFIMQNHSIGTGLVGVNAIENIP